VPIIVVTNNIRALSYSLSGDILAHQNCHRPAPSYHHHHGSKLISSCGVVFLDMFYRSCQSFLYFSSGVVVPMERESPQHFKESRRTYVQYEQGGIEPQPRISQDEAIDFLLIDKCFVKLSCL
jgi:hypothetical protein